jgi:pyruvate-formate lyase
MNLSGRSALTPLADGGMSPMYGRDKQGPTAVLNSVARIPSHQDSNRVKAFLSVPVVHDPGTKFLYNTLATYMLSAIVQKVTGEKVNYFLRSRLFDPLAIEGSAMQHSPFSVFLGVP